jgi:serine/threonine protein kinase
MISQSSQTLTRFVGPYECLEKIGVGGMGSVYKARHRDTQAIVAIKIASRRVLNEPILLKRFQYEYEAAKHLKHPRLVRALEHGYAAGAPYLVMEFVPGRSLDKCIQEHGKLPWDEVRGFAQQIGEVLEYIHRHKIIHRDIKPGNILIDENGEAKLADLGLVKNLNAVRQMTRSATGLGTMEYSAPEQFEDAKSADERADVYSLGATVYMALSGEYPFGRGGQIRILRRKLANEVEPLSKLAPHLPAHVGAAVARALRADPSQRPVCVREFIEELCRPGVNTALPTTKRSKDRRARNRVPVKLESSCRILWRRDTTLDGIIQDISPNGICLRCSRRFEVGTILQVEIKTAGPPLELVAQVRWVNSYQPHVWLMGCHFTNTLSPVELESLCFDNIPQTHIMERCATGPR